MEVWALIDQFTEGLDKDLRDELVKQNISNTPEALYQIYVIKDTRTEVLR